MTTRRIQFGAAALVRRPLYRLAKLRRLFVWLRCLFKIEVLKTFPTSLQLVSRIRSLAFTLSHMGIPPDFYLSMSACKLSFR